jgi:hypothetical protein
MLMVQNILMKEHRVKVIEELHILPIMNRIDLIRLGILVKSVDEFGHVLNKFVLWIVMDQSFQYGIRQRLHDNHYFLYVFECDVIRHEYIILCHSVLLDFMLEILLDI